MSEDWNRITYLYIRALGENDKSMGRTIASAYFHIVIILGSVVLLALFTALLLKNF